MRAFCRNAVRHAKVVLHTIETMQPTTGREYSKLVAPKSDREMLIWPEPRQILRSAWENHRVLRESEVRVLGVPLGTLRRWMRRWLGHGQDHVPLIATGHQTELHHPGVWIKNAVIDAAAARIGAVALHFAVDTDAPKHLVYRWPGGGRPISDDLAASKARWSGLARPPGTAYVETIYAEARDAAVGWGYQPAWATFFDVLAKGGCDDLSAAITKALHAVDRSLGLRHGAMVASPMWRTAGYGVFVYDICSRAEEYAAKYNAALKSYRRANGIASPGRPMPDLDVQQDICEVPFWLDDLRDGSRKRASLVREGDVWSLPGDAGAFRFEPHVKDGLVAAEGLMRFLAQCGMRLSPRALTLTSFLRLAVVDQFVHGIGGAMYDQVTNEVLNSWYGIMPPAFAVATATMFFPPAAGRARTCVECFEREERSLKHGLLGERKMDVVRQIAAAPRRSAQRAALYLQMHRELAAAQLTDPRVDDFRRRFNEARQRHAEDHVLFDRELPYTLQSHHRLEEMIGRVRESFA
jgi:hypothetical protein